jgi:peptidoglycan/LPS O-acetylase OafA/YrhL
MKTNSIPCVQNTVKFGLKQHNATLDGLRGIAAFFVVLFHLSLGSMYESFFWRSYLAVDFFFVLSGFIIAKSYEQNLLSSMSSIHFVKIRLIRLYPLILLGILIGFVVKAYAFHKFGLVKDTLGASYKDLIIALLFGLLLLPCDRIYGPDGWNFPLNFPLWSLMFEVWANIFYALFIRQLRNTVVIFILLISACGLAAASYIHNGLNGGYSETTLWIGLLRVSFSFFAGILLYRMFSQGIFTNVPRIPAWALMLVLGITMLMQPASLGWLYDLLTVLVIFPAIVVCGAFDNISARWVAPALFLGRVSYPIYVLHQPLAQHLDHFSVFHSWKLIFVMLATLGALISFSYVVSKLYDEPVRRFLNSLGRQPLKVAIVEN